MRELGTFGGMLLLLGAMSGAMLAPWQMAFDAGVWVVGAGLALGVPTGVVYHVQLYRALGPRGELPAGWIWRPLTLHDRLEEEERFGVLTWGYIGGVGFAIICLGLLLTGTAVVNALVNGP